MKISLIKKHRSEGKETYYLRYYKGYQKIEGKIKHNVSFENLNLWAYTNPANQKEKTHNKNESAKAEQILKVIEAEQIQGKFNIKSLDYGKADFLQYFKKLTEDREDSEGNHGNWKSTLKHLTNYSNGKASFKDIDDDFAEGFLKYLKDLKKTNGKVLSQNSIISYYNKFKASTNTKLARKLLPNFVTFSANKDGNVRPELNNREFLTKEEVKSLITAECDLPILKQAFLFGCYTGLRFSDIHKLVWKDIDVTSDTYRMKYVSKKTKKPAWRKLDINTINILNDVDSKTGLVFPGIKIGSRENLILSLWVLRGGIDKKITFHCSRHTFAVNALLAGMHIYTLKELLQHDNLSATEVYLQFVDQMQDEAVDKLNDYWL